jgi:hypothetical protein
MMPFRRTCSNPRPVNIRSNRFSSNDGKTGRLPIPMSARCKAQVCSRFIRGVAGSNLAKGMDVRILCLLCCVGSDLRDKLITRSEESYSVCVSNCVCLILCV